MIVPGRALVPEIVNGVRSVTHQTQPCGIDLTLKRVFKFTSAGTVDFDNSRRKQASYSVPRSIISEDLSQDVAASSDVVSSQDETPLARTQAISTFLPAGSYSVEFNETVDVPLDMMGQIFTRSSLFRSGAFMVTGVVDSGYSGPLGGMLVVSNLHGIKLVDGAKLAQIVFHQMSEKVEGYNGVYQHQPFPQGSV